MQANPYDFLPIRNLLVNSDKFKQSDGARKAFDEWYSVARLFASGSIQLDQMVRCTNECIHLMFMSHTPELFIKQNVDYYVISSLMKGFRNILTILTTKPKFQPICTHEEFRYVIQWLQKDGMGLLLAGSKNSRIDSLTRLEYSESVVSLLSFGAYLTHTYPMIFACSPFSLFSSDFFSIGFNIHENTSLRTSVLCSVSLMLEIDAVQTLPITAPLIRDEDGCRVFWTRAVWNLRPAVEIMQKVMYTVISKRGKEALLIFYNSLNEMLSKLHLELADCYPQEIDTVLYHVCNILSTLVALTSDSEPSEHSTAEELIAGRVLLQSLVHYFPNNPFVFDFVFSQQVIQLFSIAAIISPYIDLLDDAALIKYLFPYLSNTISSMSVAGVSGNEEDQDTINLLRDLALHLLDTTTKEINYTVGHMLFHTLLLAMRRGYIETERFPAVTAKVIAMYAAKPNAIPTNDATCLIEQDSSYWIQELFEGTEDRHRDMRAIKEIIAVIMGMEEEDSTIDCKIDPGVSDCIIEQFLRVHNMEVLQIFRDILLTASINPQITSISVNIQAKLLYNINNWIINDGIHISIEVINTVFLPLLRALSPIIHPSLAFLLLEITTRVFLLYNNNYHSGNAANGNQINPQQDSIMDDSLIVGILDRALQDENQEDETYYTSTSVIQKLITISGVSSRERIAVFFPYYCLTDESITVRCAALQSIIHYPELVSKYGNEILLALEMRVSGDEAHIKIGLSDLFIAAAPSLNLLAQNNLQYTPQCILYLVEGIELSIDNDLMNQPSPILVNALRSIYASTNPRDVSHVCETVLYHSPKLYSLLTKFCPEWSLEKKVDPALYAVKPVTQSAVDPWAESWRQIREVQIKGPAGFLETIYIVQRMLQNETAPQRHQMLSQYIMSTLLPSISAYYLPQRNPDYSFNITPVFLTNISSVIHVIQLLQQAFPRESEYLLHLESMTEQLMQALQQAGYDPAFIHTIEQQLHTPLTEANGQPVQTVQTVQTVQPLQPAQTAQTAQTVQCEGSSEAMKRYQENLENSKKRLQAYADQIIHPQVDDSFISLSSIAVMNPTDQLEELGVIVMKRQESKASIASLTSMESEHTVHIIEDVTEQNKSSTHPENVQSVGEAIEETKEDETPATEIPQYLADLPEVPTTLHETEAEPNRRIAECE